MYLTQENMKQGNLAAILQFIMQNGPASRRAIQQATGFSWGTVSENAAALLERGYLCEEKACARGAAGRTSCVLKLNGTRVASVGLDINRTGLTAEVVGFDHTVKHTIHRPFCAETQEEVLEAAHTLCKEALAFCQGRFRVMSIGIAFQGSVDNKAGVSLRFPLAHGWQPYSIKQEFENTYGIFTYLDHDPKCMLFAKASEHPTGNLMLIRLDEGIGMAVMQDGQIMDDVGKMELGHTLAVYHGLPCSCGRRGCLEAYASINGLCKRCDADFDTILQNRTNYTEALDDAAHHLAVAMHNAAMLFYPDSILLTGEFVTRDPAFIRQLQGVFNELEEASDRRCIPLQAAPAISAAFGAAVKSSEEAIGALIV